MAAVCIAPRTHAAGAGSSDPEVFAESTKTVATPGQAGLPAEFKHINKRRRRNLQGFP